MRFAYVLVPLLLASGAHAAQVAVRVVDARGEPVRDAVVTLDDGGGMRAPIVPRTREVDQRDESFLPYVSVFRPGDSVVFRNSDTTNHHVYSFSATKAFEQLLSPGDVGAPLRLERAGLVAVGCNIHDHMRAWLVVTDAPRVALTQADGVATFDGVDSGEWRSAVWHPHLRPKQPPVAQSFAIGAESARTLTVTLRLLPDPRGADPHRSHY
jgi:plastocyanin